MTEETQPTDRKPKQKAQRSPNFPAVSLKKGIELTKTIYDQDKIAKIPERIAHERWGYKAHSSVASQLVSALKAYGLVELEGTRQNRYVKISDTGRRIVLDTQDKLKLLKKAALLPHINRTLWEKYEGYLPQDDVLREYLIFTLKFNEDSVDFFITQFRETIFFAELEKDDILTSDEDENGENGNDHEPKPPQSRAPKLNVTTQNKGQFRELKFLLPSGDAVLYLPAIMTGSDFGILEAYLKAHKMASDQATPKEESESDSEDDKIEGN